MLPDPQHPGAAEAEAWVNMHAAHNQLPGLATTAPVDHHQLACWERPTSNLWRCPEHRRNRRARPTRLLPRADRDCCSSVCRRCLMMRCFRRRHGPACCSLLAHLHDRDAIRWDHRSVEVQPPGGSTHSFHNRTDEPVRCHCDAMRDVKARSQSFPLQRLPAPLLTRSNRFLVIWSHVALIAQPWAGRVAKRSRSHVAFRFSRLVLHPAVSGVRVLPMSPQHAVQITCRASPPPTDEHDGRNHAHLFVKPCSLLQVAPQLLLALDRFEQRLEVAFAEALRTLSLDDLEEQRRPVLHRLREDLQEITVRIAVHQYAE